MACCLLSANRFAGSFLAKPLPEQIQIYCQLILDDNFIEFESKHSLYK